MGKVKDWFFTDTPNENTQEYLDNLPDITNKMAYVANLTLTEISTLSIQEQEDTSE